MTANQKGRETSRPSVSLISLPVHPRLDSIASCGSGRGLQVLGGAAAGAAVLDHVEADLLAFREAVHPGALDGRDVNEHVRLAITHFDEAETLGGVEEFDSAGIHGDFL